MENVARIERQLTPVVGPRRAGLLTSLAEGVEGTLAANPVIAALLTPDAFPALAVIYASALRTTTEAATDQRLDEKTRTNAQETLDEMAQIVTAVTGPDPNPQPRVSDEMIDMLLGKLGGRAPDDRLLQDAEEIIR
jgi:hypothetical protein